MKCPETNKDFIVCDYNRDGDSFRSPWSNKYTPPLDDGILPSEELRKMEIAANDAFDQYREQYYDGGTSSCYFWESEGGFACCIAIKKESAPKASPLHEGADPKSATVSNGGWYACVRRRAMMISFNSLMVSLTDTYTHNHTHTHTHTHTHD